MKKTTLIISLQFFCFFGFSQELYLPVFSPYLADNHFIVSPTFAGIGDNLRIRANGLTQWVGIKDAPKNQSLYADFRVWNQSGIGISLYNDSNGNTSQLGATISFAHHIILDVATQQYLSFGLSYHLNTFKIDSSPFNRSLQTPILDPSIVENKANHNSNFGVGLLYRNRGFYISFNASNIVHETKANFAQTATSWGLNYQLYLGYLIKNSTQKNVEWEPSIYHRIINGVRHSTTDMNIKYRRYIKDGNYYWLGVSHRLINDQAVKPLTIGPMTGFKKATFYFGYSYQVNLNQIATYNSGTHLFTFGFDFLQRNGNCPCTRSTIHD